MNNRAILGLAAAGGVLGKKFDYFNVNRADFKRYCRQVTGCTRATRMFEPETTWNTLEKTPNTPCTI